METMQTEIFGLTQKLDTISQGMENLTRLVATTMAEVNANGRANSYRSERSGNLTGYETSYSHHHVIDEFASHKDILIDTDGGEMFATKSDRVLSPELQIQRLTAQLTAAYNRIAALEEQLLSRRMS